MRGLRATIAFLVAALGVLGGMGRITRVRR
jgi:hypothetical protein